MKAHRFTAVLLFVISIVAICLASTGTAGAQGLPGMIVSDPAVLNTNATSDLVGDSGRDRSVQVTTDGTGNWVAVWISDENLGDAAGTDDDIFFATLRLTPGWRASAKDWMLYE